MQTTVWPRMAIALSVLGFVLTLLSYSWVFKETSEDDEPGIVLIISEGGAVLSVLAGMVLSIISKKRSAIQTNDYKLAWIALRMNIFVILIILLPNLVGWFFFQ